MLGYEQELGVPVQGLGRYLRHDGLARLVTATRCSCSIFGDLVAGDDAAIRMEGELGKRLRWKME